MSVTFAGYPCVDPRSVMEYCRKEGLPTDWWGKANRFISPNIGLHPGRGFVLLTGKNVGKIGDSVIGKGYELVFANPTGKAEKLPNIRIVGDPISLTPGHPSQTDNSIYLVELTDRRIDCIGIANKVYNWRPYPDSNIITDEKTWYYVLKDLWDTVGGITETFPTFSTPAFQSASITASTNSPWQIDARGVRAADLLEDLLYLLGMAVEYNVKDDLFNIIDCNSTSDSVEEALFKRNAIYQSNHLFDIRQYTPQKVRVCFPVWAPRTANINDNAIAVIDVADTLTFTEGNRLTSTFCVTQDVMTARVNELGTIINSAELTLRATDVASIFFRQIAANHRPLYRIFSGFSTQDEFFDGRHVDGVFWQECGDAFSPATGICRLGRVGLPPIIQYNAITQYSTPTVVDGFTIGSYQKWNGGKTPIVRDNSTPSPIDRMMAITSDSGAAGKAVIDLFSGMNGGVLFNRSYIKESDARTEGGIQESNRRKWFYPKERDGQEKIVRVSSLETTSNFSSGSGGVGTTRLYPAYEQYYDAASGTYHDSTACWAVDVNGGVLKTKKYVGVRTDLVASKTVWQVEAYSNSPITSGSGSTTSGSGEGDSFDSFQEERLRCIGGRLKRYVRTVTLGDEGFTFSSYTYVDDQGCCECTSLSGGSGSVLSGSGSGGSGLMVCCANRAIGIIYAAVSGNGTVELVWDGVHFWRGDVVLAGCGSTLSLAIPNETLTGYTYGSAPPQDYNCNWLYFKCNPGSSGWFAAGSLDCGPPLTGGTFTLPLSLIVCTPIGACSDVTVDISET